MNWRKKASSSSTSSPLSQIFSMSWFSKFKQTSKKNPSPPVKTKAPHAGQGVGDWQISFGGGSNHGNEKRVGGNFIHNDSIDEYELEHEHEVESWRFNEMVCNVRGLHIKDEQDGEDTVLQATPRKAIRMEKPRKSMYQSRGKQRSRVKIQSPKRKKKERYERFAVVKCSYDPQKDFRDSMVEMVVERGIGKGEELEELLACYLTLNSDEYHDLIIKVFREVWIEMKTMKVSLRMN